MKNMPHPLRKRNRDRCCCNTESTDLEFRGTSQRHTGLCAHKRHTQSTLIHAGCTQASFTLFPNKSQCNPHVSQSRWILGTYRSVCCVCLRPQSDGVRFSSKGECMEIHRAGLGWGEEGPQPLFGPQRQQHLFTGWSARTLACLQQQGQWGGMRRRCHNQMQASWPSPRKGRHLLHLPKALCSKPQRTKWCRVE